MVWGFPLRCTTRGAQAALARHFAPHSRFEAHRADVARDVLGAIVPAPGAERSDPARRRAQRPGHIAGGHPLPAPPQERCALDSSVFAIARPFRLPTWRRLGRRLLRPQRFPRGGRAGRYPNLRPHMRIVRPSKTGGGTTFRTARFLAHAKFFYPALPLSNCECRWRRYLAMYQVSRRCKHRR